MADYIDKCNKIWCNAKSPRKRKIGRYNSSELAGIIDYGLTEKEWFNPKPKDLRGSKNISWGVHGEDMLVNWLKKGDRPFTEQTKDVYKIGEIEIVCVADFDFKDRILECKCPEKLPEKIKEWNKYQLEIQYQIWGKDIYIIYLGRMGHKIFKYQPSDIRLKKIIKGVKAFHNKIKKYEQNNYSK